MNTSGEIQTMVHRKVYDCAATCVAGTDPESNLFMPVIPACTPTGTSIAEQDLPSQQQKQSLQLALRMCNLQLETIGLHVLAQEFFDISNDDKPKLQKMLQASMCMCSVQMSLPCLAGVDMCLY